MEDVGIVRFQLSIGVRLIDDCDDTPLRCHFYIRFLVAPHGTYDKKWKSGKVRLHEEKHRKNKDG